MTLPTFETILVSQEGTTVVATINRPQAMNALNAPVLKDLSGLLEWIESSDAKSARALIITGAGEKAFVAGADIKEFETLDTKAANDLARRGQTLFGRLEKFRIPVIAAVNGFALGGGLELALSCDFIYASENAKFGLPECTLGLMPGYGGTVRLPRRIGVARARELTFTGGMITASEAAAMGLANRVLPQAELMKAALETATTIGTRAPVAITKIKKSILDGASSTQDQASELEAKFFGELFATQDRTEGVRAFIEKRKPAFTGN